ncbi:MAG: PQQ-dependent sugar dehydrogenase, partial [Gammaproteobacteria bacterium]
PDPPAPDPPAPDPQPPAGGGSTVGLDARPSNTTCLATDQPNLGTSIATTRVFPNLQFQSPLLMLQAPGDSSKWYLVEQRGVVKVINNVADPTTTTTFVDLQGRVNSSFSEGGLLGMAFDPSYATNGRVYLSYTHNPTSGGVLESRISRFTLSGGVLDPASEQVLLTLGQPYENHNGGNIAFGPDGFLYAGFGDGGNGGDPGNRAQNRSLLFGKLLRLDVSGTGAYTTPADNPYAGNARCATGTAVGTASCPEIYAYGLRNPWRWSFDRAAPTPDIWLADVGQNNWEEVDRIERGGNYGWRFREGLHCYNPSTNCPVTANGAPLIDPVAEYDHTLGQSITGGYVYRGTAIPSLVGRYIFGDFGSGRIFALIPDSGGTLQRTQLLASGLGISSFAQGNDGELYVLNYGSGTNGTVFRIGAGSATPTNPIKPLLSQTGCVSASDPTQPAAGLIPYAPNAPFWSDGASKARWMALPDGQKITVGTDGDWSFPNGTVLVKNFTLDSQLIETRLFMRHTDTGNWGGYTYRWNAQHTDAALVSGGLIADVGGQNWIYPSEAQCLQCHTNAAGRSLGLETRQLNSTLSYPASGRSGNQLATLDAIGMFTTTLTVMPAYPDPANTTQPLGDRARAYLHTNCAQCHRPSGGTPVSLDLRYSTAIGSTNTCNTTPSSGDLGVSGAKVILPGDAARSVLYLRMSRRDANQMPPVGSHLVDTQGAALLQQWINGMGTSCQ